MTQSILRVRTLILAMMLGATGVGMSACNTMEGFGQDVESAGDTIEDEARKANN